MALNSQYLLTKADAKGTGGKVARQVQRIMKNYSWGPVDRQAPEEWYG